MPLTRKLYCLVGLIMGTRMWYSFWDAEKDDNAAFERRVDQVLREVGERGRPIVAESVPPQTRVKRPVGPSVTAAAQSSPSAPAPAPAPATATATSTATITKTTTIARTITTTRTRTRTTTTTPAAATTTSPTTTTAAATTTAT